MLGGAPDTLKKSIVELEMSRIADESAIRSHVEAIDIGFI
jgi:hypothetical protein